MSLLDSIAKYIQEHIGSEVRAEDTIDSAVFEMEPIDDNYKIILNGNEICTVGFFDKVNNDFEDMEIAQDNPKNYLVVISNIIDNDKTDQYINKLNLLGFEEIRK